MTQEEKELLLKDLCARLPYGVHVEISWKYSKTDVHTGLEYYKFPNIDSLLNMFWDEKCISIKPYLRPMSSITEEESDELESIIFPLMKKDWEGNENPACIRAIDIPKYMDFILSHHFDYCGLIEKGLALEALKDMYKI